MKQFIKFFTLICIIQTALAINPVKQKLKQQQMVFGGFMTIASSEVIENLAMPGKLDFIWIEAEHAPISPAKVQELVIAAENSHIIPIVRAPRNGVENIKQYIGTGAVGIIIPNINSVEEAKEAIASVKYPPQGKRHIGVERANGYLANLEEYKSQANENTIVGLMVETKGAVDAIDEIAALPGLDILHIGPYDLANSLGVSRDSPELAAAIAKVERAARKNHVALGSYAQTYKEAEKLHQKGYDFFTVPDDAQMLRNGVNNFFKDKE